MVALKENSFDPILKLLESRAPEGQLRIALRSDEGFFHDMHLQQGGGYSEDDRITPMEVCINELEFHRH